MIKAAKKAISSILANADVNDKELMTAFIRAEALLNSRPLTYQTSNPKDITLLTSTYSTSTLPLTSTSSMDSPVAKVLLKQLASLHTTQDKGGDEYKS